MNLEAYMVRNVTEYLDETAARFGSKTAFADENSSLTFAELRDMSRRIGTSLLKDTVIGTPIAVCMNKTPEAIAAFMGCVYAGCAYAPVDVTMPEKRISLILSTLDSGIVIADEDGKARLDNIGFEGKVLLVSELRQAEADEKALAAIREDLTDVDPVYIIFTSGSTGVPKGVVLSHRAVIDLAEWISEALHFDETTVFGNQTPFYFDASVKDIYSTLRNGATMHIIPQKLFAFPTQLFHYLNEKKVNTILWATSAICMAANEKAFEKETPQYLRMITFAGETMPVKQFNFWKSKVPNATYVNLYGPTEAAVDSIYYVVDREFADDEALPIGRPCRNVGILILKGDEPVKGQETGEICIRGTALANGYYNNPEKTASVFVQNPLQKAYPELIYRTGDMGWYNERGEIMFAAREDDQVKHRGYRIELGEIETALSSLDGIERCCCLFNKEKDRIVFIYKGSLDRKQIMLELGKLLPKYMWPNDYHQIEEFPFNLNGKIDKVRLKEEYINGTNS